MPEPVANVGSLIGFAKSNVFDPPAVVYSDSAIGAKQTALVDPAAVSDSLIGFAKTALRDPDATSDSRIGFALSKVRNPHKPIGVKVGSAIRYAPILAYDGTTWR